MAEHRNVIDEGPIARQLGAEQAPAPAEDRRRQPREPNRGPNAGVINELLECVDNLVTSRFGYQKSTYIPSFQMFGYTVSEMCSVVQENFRVLRDHPGYHPIRVQILYQTLAVIQILRIMQDQGTLDLASQALLQSLEFRGFFDIRIPGPLLPAFQALAACVPPTKEFQWVYPTFPTQMEYWDEAGLVSPFYLIGLPSLPSLRNAYLNAMLYNTNQPANPGPPAVPYNLARANVDLGTFTVEPTAAVPAPLPTPYNAAGPTHLISYGRMRPGCMLPLTLPPAQWRSFAEWITRDPYPPPRMSLAAGNEIRQFNDNAFAHNAFNFLVGHRDAATAALVAANDAALVPFFQLFAAPAFPPWNTAVTAAQAAAVAALAPAPPGAAPAPPPPAIETPLIWAPPPHVGPIPPEQITDIIIGPGNPPDLASYLGFATGIHWFQTLAEDLDFINEIFRGSIRLGDIALRNGEAGIVIAQTEPLTAAGDVPLRNPGTVYDFCGRANPPETAVPELAARLAMLTQLNWMAPDNYGPSDPFGISYWNLRSRSGPYWTRTTEKLQSSEACATDNLRAKIGLLKIRQ